MERILASETFARSERARRLLRYLVEEELAGRSDRLKGFAIAVDVFGRAEGFDPSTDAVVRVQAGRLRELLAQYFAAEGTAEPIRITIPRGTYAPAYEFATESVAERVPADPRPAPSEVVGQAAVRRTAPATGKALPSSARFLRHLHLFWAAMATVIVMLAFVVYRLQDGPVVEAVASPGTTGSTTASIAVAGDLPDALPPVHIELKATDRNAGRVAAVLRAALSGFDTVDMIARNYDGKTTSPRDALRFVYSVSDGPSDGGVTIELQHAMTGKVLMSRALAEADIQGSRLEDDIADIATATATASGAIYDYIEQNRLQTGLTECLVLNDNYYVDQRPATHKAAYTCLENLVAHGEKSPLVYSELASLHLEAVTDGYPYPVGASEEQALALARQAIQMGRTSPYAHRAFGFVTARTGSAEESIRWMKKAYELNTYDLGMAASYGYALIFAGKYPEGTAIMARAVDAASAHPSWWDYSLFLGAFMQGDPDRAARAAEVLAASRKAHYLAARIIVADEAGKHELADKLLGELTGGFPKFAANPEAVLRAANYPKDLAERFVAALRAAGLRSAS